jgi:hypothetical protein
LFGKLDILGTLNLQAWFGLFSPCPDMLFLSEKIVSCCLFSFEFEGIAGNEYAKCLVILFGSYLGHEDVAAENLGVCFSPVILLLAAPYSCSSYKSLRR